MKRARFQFGIFSMLMFTTVTAVVVGSITYPRRKILQTRAAYDEQKRVVNVAVATFVDQLQSEDFLVINRSERHGGSGEWRTIVAISAKRRDSSRPSTCRVEIQGFVSHNNEDQPTWMQLLPMEVTYREGLLNERFVALLTQSLSKNEWQYSVNGLGKEER